MNKKNFTRKFISRFISIIFSINGSCFIYAFELENEKPKTSSVVNLNEVKDLNNQSSQKNSENEKNKNTSKGTSKDNSVDSSKEIEEVFYVTKTGKCFHKKDCYYLKRLKIYTSRENVQKKYKPCKHCSQK